MLRKTYHVRQTVIAFPSRPYDPECALSNHLPLKAALMALMKLDFPTPGVPTRRILSTKSRASRLFLIARIDLTHSSVSRDSSRFLSTPSVSILQCMLQQLHWRHSGTKHLLREAVRLKSLLSPMRLFSIYLGILTPFMTL